MRDICDWCEKVKEIIAERDTSTEGKKQKICKNCAESIGLEMP